MSSIPYSAPVDRRREERFRSAMGEETTKPSMMQFASERVRRLSVATIECVVRRCRCMDVPLPAGYPLGSGNSLVNWFRRRSVKIPDPHGMLRRRKRKTKKAGFLAMMEKYRQSILSRLWCWWLLFLQTMLHPTRIWTATHFWKKTRIWIRYYYYNCFNIGSREKKVLAQWVRSRVHNHPVSDDFTSGWKDGILMCALLDSMYPGSCPRYDLLSRDNCISNAQLAFSLIEKRTPIRPEITAEELAEGHPSIEKAVISIVSQLKLISARAELCEALGAPPKLPEKTDECRFAAEQECFAKGMGLILAVRGRRATFNVFTRPKSNFCIVVEIRGPDDSVSMEVITNKSPKRKEHRVSDQRDECGAQTGKISIEYVIYPGKVAVKYRPVLTGKHDLSIIWHGQHVMGSPYTISVEDSTDDDPQTPSPTISPSTNFNDVIREEMARRSQRTFHAVSQPPDGTQRRIRKRRVVRRIISYNGRDVVVEGGDQETLRKALRSLKIGTQDPRRIEEVFDSGPTLNVSVSDASEKDNSEANLSVSPVSESAAFSQYTVLLNTPEIVISEASPPPDKGLKFSLTDELSTDQGVTGMLVNTVEIKKATAISTNGDTEGKPARGLLQCQARSHTDSDATPLNKYGDLTDMTEFSKELELCSVEPTHCPGETHDIRQCSSYMVPASPPAVCEARTDDITVPVMPQEDIVSIQDTPRKLSRQLPVIAEESEKQQPSDTSDVEEAVRSKGITTHTTECITKYEFRLHRSVMTVNVNAAPPTEEPQDGCIDRKLDVTAPNVPAKEADDDQTPGQGMPGSPQQKWVKKARQEAINAKQRVSTPELHPERKSSKSTPLVTSRLRVPSSSISVMEMVKRWERKQEQPGTSETDTAVNEPAAPKPPLSLRALHTPATTEAMSRMNLQKTRVRYSDAVDLCRTDDALARTHPADKGIRSLMAHGSSAVAKLRIDDSPENFGRDRTKQTDRHNMSKAFYGKETYLTTADSGRGTTESIDSDRALPEEEKLTTAFQQQFRAARNSTEEKLQLDPAEQDRQDCRHSCSYTFWFGGGSDQNICQCILRKHLSMLVLHSDDCDAEIECEESSCQPHSELDLDHEYIDDDIQHGDPLLLGRYTALKDAKTYNDVARSTDFDEEIGDLLRKASSDPECCRAFGSRLYFGQVGAENHFQVNTSNTGVGPLSVGIQGPREGSVINVSVTYCGLGNYSVMYKVVEPGYYNISIKWDDRSILGSPFMCKVTY